MKAIYKHIAFAALALSVAACTQEDDFSLTYQNDPDAVRITAQVGIDEVTGGFTRSNPIGTAEEQEKFNEGDQIAVAAGTQAAVIYTYDGSDWNPETGKYLKWEDERMDVTAYYPVTEGTSATTFTVPEDQTTDIELADYMTYSDIVSKGDNKCIDLRMERKMVRIVVDNITFNGQFDTGYDVTAVTVHGNTSGYADYEVQTGNISVQALKHSDGKFYALLSPTTESADDYFITLTVQNSDVSESYELKVKGIPATTAGNSYDLSLTVGKDMASIGNISVNPWERGSITGGEATEILKATCVIDGTTAILTVPANADETSIDQAIESLTSATGLATIIINGTLTADRQATIATALAEYSGGVIFNDMKLEELIDNIKNLPLAVVVDSEDKFANTTEEKVTLTTYQGHELTAEKQGKNYVFSEQGSADNLFLASIIVKSGVHHITLSDCYLYGMNFSPIEIHPGATAYITVKGTNKMAKDGGSGYAGIAVLEGGHLIISASSEGTLEAVGQGAGAGIGGCLYNSFNESNTNYTYCSSGKVTINGGKVIATGGNYSAGIGSAGSTSNDCPAGLTCGDITINGGTVEATGGKWAAGIGGGYYNPGGNVTITGGTVNATGGDDAEGIGKGDGGEHSGTLVIGEGADVTSNGQTMSPTE